MGRINPPFLTTALLTLEAFEPFKRKSGWEFTYKVSLERQLLRLQKGEDPMVIEDERLALKERIADLFPQWDLSRSGLDRSSALGPSQNPS